MVAPLVATTGRVVSSKVVKSTAPSRGTQKERNRRGKRLTTTSENIYNKQRDSSDQKRRNRGRSENGKGRAVRQGISPNTLERTNQRTEVTVEADIGSEDSILGEVVTNYKRFRAGSASVMIFWTAIPFWVPQFVFWGIGLFGLGGESIPIANYFIPGESIFTIMNYMVMTIGIITMVYAFVMYSARMVDAFSGLKGLVFCFCVALYCVPVLNVAPWFAVWTLVVTYAQGKK